MQHGWVSLETMLLGQLMNTKCRSFSEKFRKKWIWLRTEKICLHQTLFWYFQGLIYFVSLLYLANTVFRYCNIVSVKYLSCYQSEVGVIMLPESCYRCLCSQIISMKFAFWQISACPLRQLCVIDFIATLPHTFERSREYWRQNRWKLSLT